MDKKQKLKVIKAFDKLTNSEKDQLALMYPNGFQKNLIKTKTIDGKFISVLPYETEDRIYMIRMPEINQSKNNQDFDDEIDSNEQAPQENDKDWDEH